MHRVIVHDMKAAATLTFSQLHSRGLMSESQDATVEHGIVAALTVVISGGDSHPHFAQEFDVNNRCGRRNLDSNNSELLFPLPLLGYHRTTMPSPLATAHGSQRSHLGMVTA
jgi:hypothetical protein